MHNSESQAFYDGHPYQEPTYNQVPIRTNQTHRNTVWILGLLMLMIVLGYFFYLKSQENHSETMFSLQDIRDGMPKIKKFERG